MTSTVLLKRSSTASHVPTTAQLALGELSINTYDGLIWMKKNAGSGDVLVPIATQAWVTAQAYLVASSLTSAIPAGSSTQLLAATGTAGTAAAAALSSNFVLSAGTLSLTGVAQLTGAAFTGAVSTTGTLAANGTITAGNGTATASMTINGLAATTRELIFQTAGSTRWWINANSAAESGSNVGTDLVFTAYSDAGAFLFATATAARATGIWTFAKGVSVTTGGLTVAAGASSMTGGLTLDTLTLSGSSTVTTQAIGDSSGKIASTAYVMGGTGAFITVALAGSNVTLTTAQLGSANTIFFNGQLTANVTVTLPASFTGTWTFSNSCTQLSSVLVYTVSVKITGGTAIVLDGGTARFSADGASTVLYPVTTTDFASDTTTFSYVPTFVGPIGYALASNSVMSSKHAIKGWINADDEFGHSGIYNIRVNSDAVYYTGSNHLATLDIAHQIGTPAAITATLTTSDLHSVTVNTLPPNVVVSTYAPTIVSGTNVPLGAIVVGLTYASAASTTATGTKGQYTITTGTTLSGVTGYTIQDTTTPSAISPGTNIVSIVGTTVTLSQPLAKNISGDTVSASQVKVTFAPDAAIAPTGTITFTCAPGGPRLAFKTQMRVVGALQDAYAPTTGGNQMGYTAFYGIGTHITTGPAIAPAIASTNDAFGGNDNYYVATPNHHALQGRETDVGVTWGGSVARLGTIAAVRTTGHSTRGSFTDVAFNIASQVNAMSVLNVFEIGGPVSLWPLGPDSKILTSHEQVFGGTSRQTLYAGFGTDFSANTFTYDAWRSLGARIDGVGNIAASSVSATTLQGALTGLGSITAIAPTLGTGYGAVPTMIIQAPATGGTQAVATVATVGLSSVNIIGTGGLGWTVNQVVSVGAGGGSIKILTIGASGQALTANVNAVGSYSSVSTNPITLASGGGTGLVIVALYTPLTVTVGTTGAGYSPSSQVFYATDYSVTTTVTMTAAYVSTILPSGTANFVSWPLVWIAPPGTAGGVQAQATVQYAGATASTMLTGGANYVAGDYVVCQYGVTWSVTSVTAGVITASALVNTNATAVSSWVGTIGSGRIPPSNFNTQVFSTSGAGGLGQITISAAGSNYTNGTYPLTIGGVCTEQAMGYFVVAGGVVTAAYITHAGSGYTSGQVTVSAAFGATSGTTTYATLSVAVGTGSGATFVVTGISPVQIAMINPGQGYGSAPAVHFSDGYGVSTALTLGNTQMTKLSNSGELITLSGGAGISGTMQASLIGNGTGTVRVTTDGATAGATNTLPIAAGHAMTGTVQITARNTSNGDLAFWNVPLAARNIGGTITIVQPTTATGITPTYSGGTLTGCTLGFTADATNLAVNITISGIGANTVNVQASLHGHMN